MHNFSYDASIFNTPRIYLAGPVGPVEGRGQRVKTAIDFAEAGAECGIFFVVPHLYHFWDQHHPRSYEYWLNRALRDMFTCAGVFRLPGASPGADLGVREARKNGLTVYEGADGVAGLAELQGVHPDTRSRMLTALASAWPKVPDAVSSTPASAHAVGTIAQPADPEPQRNSIGAWGQRGQEHEDR